MTDSVNESEPGIVAFEAAVADGLPASWDWRQPMILAVSGGADSMALLHSVAAITPAEARRQLLVAHVEYDLRETAERDRRFVIEQAERLQLTCYWKRCPLTDSDGAARSGLEAAARALRYDFFSSLAHLHGARHVAVGHTLDDQAETILHRILRGTGIAGLAGMARSRQLTEGVSLVRPLLALRRQQVREYLRTSGAFWVEDESNADLRFARNLLRHRVLAAAEQGHYPAATEALVRLGDQAAALMANRRVTVERLIEQAVERRPDGSLLLHDRLVQLAGGDCQLLADLFSFLWQQEGWPRRDLTQWHLETLARMLVEDSPHPGGPIPAFGLPGNIQARRDADGIVLQPPAAAGSKADCSWSLPASTS